MKPVALPHQAPKPLTAEEKRAELIRVSQQKLAAMTEGAIFNILHNADITKTKPEEIVDYAFSLGQAYVAKMYGVTFHNEEKETAE